MIISVSEIGLSWLHEFKDDSLGNGNKFADFQIWGTLLVFNDRLKIFATMGATSVAKHFQNQYGKLSGPAEERFDSDSVDGVWLCV